MNNSSGAFYAGSFPGYSPGFVPTVAAVTIIIIILALAGNILVCLAIGLNSRLRKQVTNYFLVSLAVADILTAGLHMTLAVDSMLKDFRWNFTEEACKLYITMYLFAAPSSIFSLLAVSVDRFLALSKPLQYRHAGLMSRKRALVTIASLWIYSFIYALLPVIGWKSHPRHVENGYCYYNLTKSYIISSSVLNFCIPNVIMCIIYGKIYCIAKAANFRQNGRPRLVSNSSFSVSGESCKTIKGTITSFTELRSPTQKHDSAAGTTGGDSQSSSESGNELQPVAPEQNLTVKRQKNKQPKCPALPSKMQSILPKRVEVFRHSGLANKGRVKRKHTKLLRRSSTRANRANEQKFFKTNMKAAQTVALIVSCFMVCWMPNTVCSFVIVLCPTCIAHVPLELLQIFLTLTYVNSCINPLLYGLQRRDFRNAFKKILQFRCNR